MKVETRLFLVLGIFFLPLPFIYGFWEGWHELAGPIALFLSSLLCFLVFFFLQVTSRKFTNRPEDDPRGEIAEQEGDYGFFTPYSWWPLWLGLSAAVAFAGLAVGWWLFIIGALFGLPALIGWTFEHYKGEYAN